MPLTLADRALAAVGCAYFCYRIIRAVRTGVFDGNSDRDVRAADNPGAFGLTLISAAFVALLLAFLVVCPNAASLTPPHVK